MKMKDKFSKQSSPEEFWGAHIKRHSSASNISNQLYNECVNQNIVFLTQRFGQFSSLENLSSKLYKEHKDDRFYVRSPTSSRDRETEANDSFKQKDEPSYDKIFKSHDKPFAKETKKGKVKKSMSINPKNKSNTINRLMKSFSLKRPKESKNVVYLERFQTLSSDFTEHSTPRRRFGGAEDLHELSLLRESLVTGHLCHHLVELDL